MAELPEYRKQRAIEPAPVVQGVREAYNATGEVSSMIAEIGSQIAQNAANEMAAIKGQQAAEKNPGKKLLPAWTESDKHFQEAFKKEAYSNSAFAATQLIQKQQLLFEQNPSTFTLQLYEKNLIPGLQNIINNSPEGIRNQLQKSTMESYNQSYFDATRAVVAKNRADMISNTKARIDENYKNIYNSAKDGFGIDAKNKYDTLMADISSLKANGGADAQQIATMKDTAKNMLSTGKYNGMVATAYRGGEQDAADFIRDFANNKPSNRTPIEHEFIVKNMLNEYTRLQGESADSKHLALMDYKNDIDQNTLTPTKLAEAPQVLGDAGFKQFTKDYNKAVRDNAISAEISFAAFNGQQLGGYTTEQVNKAFDGTVKAAQQAYAAAGKEFGYIQRIQLAEPYKDNRLHIVGETRNKILRGSAQDIAEASIAIKRSDAKQSGYLDDIGDEARAIAVMFEVNSVDKTKNIEDIAVETRKKIRDISPEDLKQRGIKFAQMTAKSGAWMSSNPGEKYKLYDTNALQDKLSNDLGFGHWVGSPDKIPTQLVAEYKAAMKHGYDLTEDLEYAHDNAIRLLKMKSGKSDINGESRPTLFPLEKTFPFKSITRLRNDAVVEISDKFVEQEKLFTKGKTSSYYKFANDALKPGHKENYIYDNPVFNGKKIKIVRVYKNRNNETVEQPGYMEIGYDQLTGINTGGNQFPSYPIQFAPEKGKTIDIYDPNETSVELRFYPALADKKEAEIKKNRIIHDKFRKIAFQLELDADFEFGER